MIISELIKKLEELKETYGDVEVTYIDNGPFADKYPELDPAYVERADRIIL